MAANRDEHYARPTAKAAFWPEAPDLLAGRDLEAGGTWLGITRSGRFAAITNFRDGLAQKNGAPSRGQLVSEFLRSELDPATYLRDLSASAERYNGFNLVLGDRTTLRYYSNRGEGPCTLDPGVYGLSNHLLDSAWPKVVRGKAALQAYLCAGPGGDRSHLMAALAEREPAADNALPDTGVGLAVERALSPLFIATPNYGTRCSTVIERRSDGFSTFFERSFTREGVHSDVSYEFWSDGSAVLPSSRNQSRSRV